MVYIHAPPISEYLSPMLGVGWFSEVGMWSFYVQSLLRGCENVRLVCEVSVLRGNGNSSKAETAIALRAG